MKKKARSDVRPQQLKAGFYGPEFGSPQNVEFGKATELSYLHAGEKRALEIKDNRKMYNTFDNLLRNRAHYQGGGTFCLDKSKE